MKKVILYSTPTCVYCKLTKDFLKKHTVAYTEHNVADDVAARQEMIQKSHQMGVPVVDIEGEIFVGFDKDGMSQALGLEK